MPPQHLDKIARHTVQSYHNHSYRRRRYHTFCTVVKQTMNATLVIEGAIINKRWFWTELVPQPANACIASCSTLDSRKVRFSRTLANRCVLIRPRHLCRCSECLVAAPECLCLSLHDINSSVMTDVMNKFVVVLTGAALDLISSQWRRDDNGKVNCVTPAKYGGKYIMWCPDNSPASCCPWASLLAGCTVCYS